MNTEDHPTPPPLVLQVSYDKADDNSIGSSQISEVEPLVIDGPLDIPIPFEPPPHKLSEEAPEGAQSEGAPEGSTPGYPIW